MEKIVLSKFKELPKLKLTWIVFGFFIFIILGLMASIITSKIPLGFIANGSPYDFRMLSIYIIIVVIFSSNLDYDYFGLEYYVHHTRISTWLLAC